MKGKKTLQKASLKNTNSANTKITKNKLESKRDNTFDPNKIENLKNEIIQDIKKINNLNTLIQEFLNLYSQSSVKKSTLKDSEIVYNAIKEIFEFFIINKKSSITLDLKKFLNEKLNLFMNILIDLIDHEDSADNIANLLNKPLEIYQLKNFHLKYYDNKNNASAQDAHQVKNKLEDSLYDKLIEKLILNFDLIEAENIKALSEHLIKNADLSHLFKLLQVLSEKINFENLINQSNQKHEEEDEESIKSNLSERGSEEEAEEKSSKNSNFMFFNLYNFIISIPKLSELKGSGKKNKKTETANSSVYLIENSEVLDAENKINLSNYEIDQNILDKKEILYFCFEKNLKKFYEIIITKIVNCDRCPNEIISNLLINLNKVVLENLENPLIFSDFLINIYEKANEKDFSMKVLSLSGLFILITKYKLDYQNYYNMLYQSLCQNHYDGNKLNFIFDSKYRNRIFKIFEISLKPSSVPILVILSFLKKLARICLYNSPANIAILLGLIFNILKNHPKALLLLIRKRKSYEAKKLKSESKFLSSKRLRQEDPETSSEESKKAEKSKTEFDSALNENIVLNSLEKFEKEMGLNEEAEKAYCKYDQFIESEMDPHKTNAQNSCMWELYSLKTHYNFKIRSLVHKFERNFLKSKEFDVASISDLKENDLLYEMGDKANFYFNATAKKEEIKDCIGKKLEDLM